MAGFGAALKLRFLLMVPSLVLMPAAHAQRGGNCVSATALQLQPIVVVPDIGAFNYRLQVFNAGGGTRNFSYHFPLPLLTPPQGAVYAFNIRSKQSIIIQLGSTQLRASDEALRNALRITCHS